MWRLSTAEGLDLLGSGGAAPVGARIAHASRDPRAPLVTFAMVPGMSDDAARDLAQRCVDAKEGAGTR